MTERTKMESALIEELQGSGDPEATAQVVATVTALPLDDNYIPAVTAAINEVWGRKLARATARDEEANRRADALAAMNRLPPSNVIH